MATTRHAIGVFAAAIGTVLLSGCSAGTPDTAGNVFTVVTGFSQGIRATTVDVVDVGLAPLGLYNTSNGSVRLLGVGLVSAAPSVHIKNVTAYGAGQGVGIVHGDLLKYCPANKPYPVRDDVTPPNSRSRWNIVLALTFSKPGTYKFREVRITYATNGHEGWQYENIFTTIVVTKAHQGAKPGFDGCP